MQSNDYSQSRLITFAYRLQCYLVDFQEESAVIDYQY
jgi:hypothetical protein